MSDKVIVNGIEIYARPGRVRLNNEGDAEILDSKGDIIFIIPDVYAIQIEVDL